MQTHATNAISELIAEGEISQGNFLKKSLATVSMYSLHEYARPGIDIHAVTEAKRVCATMLHWLHLLISVFRMMNWLPMSRRSSLAVFRALVFR